MFQAYTETGPEAPAGDQFPIGTSGIMIGANGGARSHIALSENGGCTKKGIIMVLFMCREYQRVEHFTTGDGGIITEK